MSGVGPTLFARNGGGDPYFTDGDIALRQARLRLRALRSGAPQALPDPPQIEAKNALFSWLRSMWRALP